MSEPWSRVRETRELEVLAALDRDDLGLPERRKLVEELDDVGTGRSVEALRANLRQPDLKTAVAAGAALSGIGTDEAIDALADFVRTGTGPPFTFAVHDLGIARAARARPALIETLRARAGELGDGKQRVIIQALARMPHRSEIPVLASALMGRSFGTRRVAAMALSAIRAPEARTALEDASRSLSWLAGLPVRYELRRLR
jgi:HEAT repeat protein